MFIQPCNIFFMKKSIYFSIIFILISLVSFAQIVNEGVLKIKDGTTVYFGEEYTNKVGATHDNEGNLHLNSNLINNGLINESSNADLANGITYFDSPTNGSATTNAIQTISGSSNKVAFENMVVSNTTGVSVADGMELIVEKGVTLTSGDLRMVGESQLIQKHTGANSNSGNTKLLIDQQGTTDTYNYNFWSSPVSGATAGSYTVGAVLYDGTDSSINSFTPSIATYTTGAPWNGTPSTVVGGSVTTALNLESYWLWKFENGNIDDGNDWFLIRNTTAISPGLGYTMKGSGAASANQNYVFKGKPNDGTYNLVLGANKSSLVGNPYPSAIDGNSFITQNAAVLADITVPSATLGALYFWEHWGGNSHFQNNYQGGYATYTLVGGTPPTSHPDVNGGGTSSGINGARYIPVGQGFFVETATGGTITFNNNMRIFQTEGANSHFFRPANGSNKNATEDLTQRIRLGYNNSTGFYRQIMTAFVPECSDGHNTAYDARMVDVNPEDLYWITNNKEYVIDARPFRADLQIPLGLKVTNSGIQSIFVEATDNFDDAIYILDTDTGFTHDIRQSNFEVNLEPGVYNNRFKLVFQPASTVSVDDVVTSSLQVYFTKKNKEITITNLDKLTLKSAKVYNTIGQLIKIVSKSELLQNEIKIPFHVASGTYLINIETTIGKGAFKIIAY